MKKGVKLLGLVAGIAILTAVTVGGAVFADEPEDGATQAYCTGYGWHGFQGGDKAVCSETVSEFLGITDEDLCDLREEGESLADIAADYGFSTDELVAAIMAEKIKDVETMVDEGTITQEQANLMIERMTERTELAVTRTATGPVEWRMGGGNGQCNEGTGTGSANRWGNQNETGRGSCYGDSNLGTGPGGMNKWGRGGR